MAGSYIEADHNHGNIIILLSAKGERVGLQHDSSIQSQLIFYFKAMKTESKREK